MIYNFKRKLFFKHIVTWFVNKLVSIVRRLILFKSKYPLYILSFIIRTNLVQQLTMKINQSSIY